VDGLPVAPLDQAVPLTDARSFRVVAAVAGVIALPFIAAHLMIALATVPSFASLYADMGGTMPTLTQLLVGLSKRGALAFIVVVLDVGLFAGMYALAKRYWIGLLFAPIFAYLAMSAVVMILLYLPLYDVVTLVE
jgi:hypothetical protein